MQRFNLNSQEIMELSVYNIKGEDTGRKVVLDDAIYGIEPNDHAIYLAVKQYMANRRQGTAKSKERSEISGSTRKLGRQKGGGGARRGDIKVDDKKSLVVLPDVDRNVYLSGRNLQGTKVTIAKTLNTYIVLDANVILMTEKSVKEINEAFNKKEA